MTRKRLAIALPLALVALLAVFALIGAVSDSRHAAASESAAATGGAAIPAPAGREALDGSGGSKASDASGQAAGENGSGYAAGLPPAASSATHYLVRTGDLQLLIARNGLQPALARITSVTTAFGGYVLSSYSGTGTPPWIGYGSPTPEPAMKADDSAMGSSQPSTYGNDTTSDGMGSSGGAGSVSADGPVAARSTGVVPFGEVTVRIPSARFDAAIARFSDLGHVDQVTTSSTDVSDQMVDLKARLRHELAVERRLLGFLAQAKTVQAALAVQDRLDEVQLTIEQLKGQLAMLDETTSYGTLTVSLRERGVPQPGAIDQSDSFTGAFVHSLHLIADGARVTAVALGALLPFAALFGTVAAIVWYLRRWMLRRRPGQPQTLEG